MREYIFRGKTEDGKWVYGYVDATAYKDLVVIHTYDTTYKVLPDTVGQYTGLDDANGEEIYEGDIVRYRLTDERYKKNPRYSNLPIHYDGRHARFEAGNIYWDTLRSDKVEVIGNIYDNPKLIEK